MHTDFPRCSEAYRQKSQCFIIVQIVVTSNKYVVNSQICSSFSFSVGRYRFPFCCIFAFVPISALTWCFIARVVEYTQSLFEQSAKWTVVTAFFDLRQSNIVVSGAWIAFTCTQQPPWVSCILFFLQKTNPSFCSIFMVIATIAIFLPLDTVLLFRLLLAKSFMMMIFLSSQDELNSSSKKLFVVRRFGFSSSSLLFFFKSLNGSFIFILFPAAEKIPPFFCIFLSSSFSKPVPFDGGGSSSSPSSAEMSSDDNDDDDDVRFWRLLSKEGGGEEH